MTSLEKEAKNTIIIRIFRRFSAPKLLKKGDRLPEYMEDMVDFLKKHGKTEETHNAILYGAKILAGAAYELITKPELLQAVKAEIWRKNAEAQG